MKKRLSLLAILLPFLIQAQQSVFLRCGTDEMRRSRPGQLLQEQLLEEVIMAKRVGGLLAMKPNPLPHILPVVVHIVHQNGAENIPDAQVMGAIGHLNQAFAHEGYYALQGDGANTQIQFCLARRTPDGQLTNGITRTESELTEMVQEFDDLALKDLIRWDPTQYVNIWVVASISSQSAGDGVAGYAYLAASHGQPNDGLVCEAQYFGVDAAQDGVVVHEMGHYLNLYHTFEGGCPNGNCQTGGDRVCDTPPDQATHTNCDYNSCGTDADDASANNPFNADVDDATENFMDYSPFGCYRNFTGGQTERMHFAIENFRSSLLESEGCKDPCSVPIAVAFLPSATNVAAGETVFFANQTSGAANYEWYVNGNLAATSTDFSYQFTGAGNFLVELKAFNADPNCLGAAEAAIAVLCNVGAAFSVNGTELEVGEVLACTNTSTGANQYEWFINGANVGTAPDLGYTFSNIGIYTILLQATGDYCSAETSLAIIVIPPSGSELCDDTFDNDGDGYVDCFDTDCHCFDGIDCTADSLLAAAPIVGKLAWQSPLNLPGINNVPLVANLDPQNGGIPEIIVAEGISDNLSQNTVTKLLIYQGDGSNAANPDVLAIPQQFSERNSAPVIGDVNSDGVPELAIVTWDNLIRVYTGFSSGSAQAMSLFATSDLPTNWTAAHLGLADFNADGIPEIYSGNQIFQFDFTSPNNPLLKRKLQGNMHNAFNGLQATAPVAADVLSVNDCNGDPDCSGLELVAGAYAYSVDLDPLDGDGPEIKIARSLNAMLPTDNFLDGYNCVADLNLDGVLDIVTVGRHGPSNTAGFYVWDKNGLLARFTNPNPDPIVDKQFFTIAIDNVYDDKTGGYLRDFPEIVYTSSNRISAFNLQLAQANPSMPFWWSVLNQDVSGASGPSCFDFNADGFAEIIHRDERSLRLMYGGPQPFPPGVDADRNWVKIACHSQTIDEYPVVADVDADGQAEIVATGYMPPFVFGQSDYRGRLWVVESGALPWSPARPVWNQFNYFGVNVNDDLSIPSHQQLHHLELPALGSGKRPLNTSRAQWPPLDENFDHGIPVPDAWVSVDSSACDGTATHVWFKLCNAGSRAIPPDLPISFYINDPRQPGAVLHSTIYSGPGPVPVDSCLYLSTTVANVLAAPVFVVANDSGTHTLPYALPDFPLTDLLECGFGNNFGHFALGGPSAGLDLGPDRSLCSSSVALLNAGTGFSAYHWQNGSADSTFTASGPGTYWVDAWDVCGNRHTDTLVIFPDQSAVVELGGDRILCGGESIQLAVQGFASVQWSPGTGLSCDNCPATLATPGDTTTYYVTAATDGGCFASDSIRIFPQAQPLLSLTAQDGDCSMLATVAATASGSASFDFVWSNGATGAAINPSQSGTYTVTVTNEHGCKATASATVEVEGQLSLDLTTLPVSCTGNPGQATVEAAGGTAPYTYLWSNGSQAQSISVALPGELMVTVTDANGCISGASVAVGTTGGLSLTITLGTISCHDSMDGTASVVPLNGTPPFAWQWQSGQTDSILTGLGGGSYAVTITDAIGCSDQLAFAISGPLPLELDIEGSNLGCFGAMEGTATVSASGGTPGYEYFWSNFHTSATASNLAPGWHTVTVTDQKGCKDTTGLLITEPPLLSAMAQASSGMLCPGETTSVTATATGGTPPLSFLWNNGQMGGQLVGLGAGNYLLTVTDANNCTATASALVLASPPILFALDTIIPASGPATADGSILIGTAGGTAPLAYNWNNGATTEDLTAIPPGDYSLTVTDAEGCGQVFSFTVDFMSAVPQPQGTGWDAVVYPNPAMDGAAAYLSIRSPAAQAIELQIFDVAGKAIGRERFGVPGGSWAKPLALPEVAGVYLLVLSNERDTVCLKWVVF